MKTIKIIANNINLDFVASSLTLKNENNAFSQDFKVTHSSFPFLIIENDNTQNALGSRDITSVNKKKVIEVDVFELDKKFRGELQILSYIKGFRKCNLKYASDILPILSHKIKDYMPTVSVIPNEDNPVEYLEENSVVVDGSEHWKTYVSPFYGKVFPQVKWQFPLLLWQDLFNDQREVDDPWYLYQDHINLSELETQNTLTSPLVLVENQYQQDTNVLEVQNRNVVAPQIFLLTPLYYIFESVGYKIKGNAITNPFLKRVLFLSLENNLTKVELEATQTPLTFPSNTFENWNPVDNNYQATNTIIFQLTEVATYKLKYYLKIYSPEDNVDSYSEGKLYLRTPDGNVITIINQHIDTNNTSFLIFEGSVNFNIQSGSGQICKLYYVNTLSQMPIEYTFTVSLQEDNKTYHQMHPTIDTSRYVPNWSVVEYINELKKTFNITVTPDDYKKEVVFSLNEKIPQTVVPEILSKSLQVSSFNAVSNTSFTLKFANDEDDAIYITKSGANLLEDQTDTFNKVISNKFKEVPYNFYTSELSEALKDKNGVGLILYDENRRRYTSESYLGNTLKFTGEGNLYIQFWKRWLKFRLTASSLEIEGPFTRQEIQKFANKNEIYIDHQHYRIVSYSFTEETPGVNIVKFSLESVNL